MSAAMFRYQLKQNFAYSKVKVVCGQSSAEVRVAPHSLFNQVKQIHLKVDEFNTKFLELVQKGEVFLPPGKSSQFVKRWKETFDTDVLLDVAQVGVNLMLSNNDQDIKTLDFLDFKDLLSIVAIAFDKTGVKLHSKVIRKLKGYIKNSTRSKEEKQTLESINKSYKQAQNLQEDEQQDQGPVVEKKQSRKQQRTKYKKIQDDAPTKSSKTQQSNAGKKIDKKPSNDAANVRPSDDDDQSEEDVEQAKDYVQKKPRGERKGRKAQGGRNYTPQQQGQTQQYDNKRRPGSRSSNRNSNRSDRSGDKRNDFRGASAGKQKLDPKIMLGITGDTQFGWRQRNRPTRYPARNALDVDESYDRRETASQNMPFKKQEPFKKQNQYSRSSKDSQRVSKTQKSQKVRQNKDAKETTEASITKQKTEPKESVEQKSTASFAEIGEAKRVFMFPRDGNKFDFKKLKSNFMLFINGSFWIKYTQKTLSITKGQNGYIRQCKMDFIDNGLMGEGLTLTLDGNSNIQDGGDTIGTPKIEDFTGSPSQFFHVITLSAYVPK